VNVLKTIGMGGKGVQRRRQHRGIAFDILDTTFAERCASGKKRVRHRFDACERAPAGLGIRQIGSNMAERRTARWRRSRQAVDAPSGAARKCGGDGSTGRSGRSDNKCDPVSHCQ
jgi:hypothetical protein